MEESQIQQQESIEKGKKQKKFKPPHTYRVSWPVVFILLLLAFGGYAFWSYTNTTKLQSKLSAQTEEVKNKQAELAQVKADRDKATDSLLRASATEEYVVISEWGVQFKPGNELNIFTYFINGSTLNSSTTSLMKIAAVANGQDEKRLLCTPYDLPIGAIVKYNTAAEAPANPAPLLTKKLGTVTYGYTPPQATCSDDKATNDLAVKQVEAMKVAFSTLELTE